MTDADERLGSAQRERSRVNYRLVPQFEPTRAHRLIKMNRWVRNCFDGEKRSDTVAQADRAERRVELGQCCDSKILGEFLDGRHGGTRRRTTEKALPLEVLGREFLQHFASLDPAFGQSEDDEVGAMCIEHRAQLRDMSA